MYLTCVQDILEKNSIILSPFGHKIWLNNCESKELIIVMFITVYNFVTARQKGKKARLRGTWQMLWV
jgi:hypothetical protein